MYKKGKITKAIDIHYKFINKIYNEYLTNEEDRRNMFHLESSLRKEIGKNLYEEESFVLNQRLARQACLENQKFSDELVLNVLKPLPLKEREKIQNEYNENSKKFEEEKPWVYDDYEAIKRFHFLKEQENLDSQ